MPKEFVVCKVKSIPQQGIKCVFSFIIGSIPKSGFLFQFHCFLFIIRLECHNDY